MLRTRAVRSEMTESVPGHVLRSFRAAGRRRWVLGTGVSMSVRWQGARA